MPILLSRHTGTHRIPTAPTPEARTPTPLIDTALIDIVGEPVV